MRLYSAGYRVLFLFLLRSTGSLCRDHLWALQDHLTQNDWPPPFPGVEFHGEVHAALPTHTRSNMQDDANHYSFWVFRPRVNVNVAFFVSIDTMGPARPPRGSLPTRHRFQACHRVHPANRYGCQAPHPRPLPLRFGSRPSRSTPPS